MIIRIVAVVFAAADAATTMIPIYVSLLLLIPVKLLLYIRAVMFVHVASVIESRGAEISDKGPVSWRQTTVKVTTIFIVQPSFHHRHLTNPVS